jgi:poly-gamma-glutamate synthesis protein (capsule biosynthesis protein)
VGDGVVTVFACGDVMPGRGVDQILPHPGDPELREAYARDARAYVDLAEDAHGPIPRPVSYCWPWGDALRVLDELAPDVRVINLEASITTRRGFAPGKAICYRMSPGNLSCVTAARPEVCALANNHVLDFGRGGLADTLRALASAGLRAAGPGPAARRPGGRRRSRCAAAGARSSSPAAPVPAASRPAGPPPRAGPGSTCCLTCRRPPPGT